MNHKKLFYVKRLNESEWCIMMHQENGNSVIVESALSKNSAEILLKKINDALSWWFEI